MGPWIGDGSLTIEGGTYPVSYEIRFRLENRRHVFEGKVSGLPRSLIGSPSQSDRLELKLSDGRVVPVALWPATGKIMVQVTMPNFG